MTASARCVTEVWLGQPIPNIGSTLRQATVQKYIANSSRQSSCAARCRKSLVLLIRTSPSHMEHMLHPPVAGMQCAFPTCLNFCASFPAASKELPSAPIPANYPLI